MRILITGGAGFVGSAVAAVLASAGHDIVVVDSFLHKGRYDRLSDISGLLTVVPHDLTIPFSSSQTNTIGTLDAIVHFASESHVTRSIMEPVHTMRNNVMGTTYLLDWVITSFPVPPEFILFSTDEVYGSIGIDDPPVKEWATIVPSSPYAASKCAQEAIATAYWRTYGLPLVITNCMNIYGPKQDPEKYLPKALKYALDGLTLPVHCDSHGLIGSRSYMHTTDVARAIRWLLNYPVDALTFARRHHLYGEHCLPVRYNFAGYEANNLEFAQMVAQAAGIANPQYSLVNAVSRPGHDMRYALDDTKARSHGFYPHTTLETGIKQTVSWYLNHQNWLD
jgi:dTDP-glucose 4,6-dehydratase